MILVISTSGKSASNLADMFRYMGILSIGMTPSRALSKVSFLYRAIILMHPDEFPDYIDYIRRLKKYSPESPIFSVSSNDKSIDRSIFDANFSQNTYAANILKKIVEFAKEKGITPPGRYRRTVVDLSVEHTTPTILGDALNLTKTESMVLRYLIQVAPQPASPEEIISHIYNPAKAPNPSNIRTYVSIINKKASRVYYGKNIVFSIKGKGYVFRA